MSGNLHLGRIALFVSAVVAAVALLPRSGSTRAEEPEAVAALDIGLNLLQSGLGPMTYIANAGDARLFLVIQTGQIRIYTSGSVLSAPFLDIRNLLTPPAGTGERGLLSVAFHPQYALNGFFFVYYTDVNGDVTIARYHRSASDANLADPAGIVLLTIPHPTNSNHNGGQLQFGPDGYLYIGTGDGGSSNDPPCNAQNDGVLLGKLLRIDVDQNVNTPPFYGIPLSNPFVGAGLPLDEIWAKGLRNPWRFSFDRLTGDLWIGDVGQNLWEEIDFQPNASPGGKNYGWKVMEGFHCNAADGVGCAVTPPLCGSPSYVLPVFEYDHGGGRCSVTGGYVYRGSQDPTLFGRYLYGDYCSGQIWGWSQGVNQLFTPNVSSLTTFGEDAAGELYIGTGGGQLFRIVHVVATPTPTPTATPLPTPTPTPSDLRPGFPLSSRHRPLPPQLAPRQPI
jgi:glucose/arabinose dehydrogenase